MKFGQVCICVVLLLVGTHGWAEEVEQLDDVIENANTFSESAESFSRLGCDDSKCNRKCKDKGKTGGQCILGRCKCNIKSGQDEVIENADTVPNVIESAESLSRLGCDDSKCNRKCRDKGRTGGQCILGRCKCNIKSGQDEVIENADTVPNVIESAESLSRLGCDDSKCNRKCKDKGRTGGQCILGRCKCNIK